MSGRTFAQSIAARDAHWVAYVIIEGSGRSDGELYRYCSELPAFASDAYRDWLLDWPKVTAERIDPLGGMPENGSLEVSILDFADRLTSEWRINAPATTYLDEPSGLSSTATTVHLASVSGLSAPCLLYVGSECMTVEAIDVPTRALTVGRGKLETDPVQHGDGAPVHTHLPYIHTRRAWLYVVDKLATDVTEAKLIGEYRFDDLELTEDLNGYTLKGKSQLKWFARQVGRRPVQSFEVVSIGTGATWGPNTPVWTGSRITRLDFHWGGGTIPAWPTGDARTLYLNKSTGEIFSSYGTISAPIFGRGLYDTDIADIQPGHEIIVVFGADPDDDPAGPTTWFRFSPAPSPSSDRTVGTWTRSANWIDLILNLATSAADPYDGLELVNFDAAYGNWSCLPPGIGIGVPYSQIDLAAAMAVKTRTPNYVFPDLVLGDGPVSFADLITKHFLRPLGAYISVVGGVAKILLPRSPLEGEAAFALGPAEILGRKVNKAGIQHRLGVRADGTKIPSGFAYTFGPRRAELLVTNGDYSATYGQGGWYANEEEIIPIDAPSVRPGLDGRSAMLEGRGLMRVARARRVPFALQAVMGSDGHGLSVGTAVAITHEQLPNLDAGRRGWVAVPGEVSQSSWKLDPAEGQTFELEVRSAGAAIRRGRIAPAARVSSVSAGAGSTRVVTVAAARYVAPDNLATWPTSDAAGFTVGDVLRLHVRSGALVTAATETVTATGAGTVTLSGNFGGALLLGGSNAGQVLRFAPRATASARQAANYVDFADTSTGTVGASTDRAWSYAEA